MSMPDGDAGGGDDVALVDEARVLATSTPKRLEVLDRAVVRDRAAAVEDARLGEQHRARADRADPPAGRVALGERAP